MHVGVTIIIESHNPFPLSSQKAMQYYYFMITMITCVLCSLVKDLHAVSNSL